MGKNLIINLGPFGDIVRNTILLPVLKGENFWLTKSKFKDLLTSPRLKKAFFIEDPLDMMDLANEEFDVVISLNEEMEALKIVQKLKYKKIIGVFLKEDGSVGYTPESNPWFDMSLCGKFGKEEADRLKMNNTKTYSEMIIEMVGEEWKGQEYDLGVKPIENTNKIGLIKEANGLWANKGWTGYDELKDILSKEGYEVEFLEMRDTLIEHVEDINQCGLIVCGDTAGKEIALALGKRAVVLFNCTSPNEIEDYGRIRKIVSPLYKKFFYKKGLNNLVINSISVPQVHDAVKELMQKSNIY